jgi:hypothetical protein
MSETYDTKRATALLHKLAAQNVSDFKADKKIPEADRGKAYIVKSGEFMAALKREGIPHPENIMTFWQWAEPIAKHVLPRYRRALRRKP